MMVFLSCAHKSDSGDEADWEAGIDNSEEKVSDAAEATTSDEFATNLEEAKTDTASAEATETPAETDESKSTDWDLSEITDESNVAKPEEHATLEEPQATITEETASADSFDIPTEDPSSVGNVASSDQPSESVTPLEGNIESITPLDMTADNSLISESDSAESVSQEGSPGALPSTEAPIMPKLNLSASDEPRRAATVSQAPEISRTAISKSGQNLNRFYFIRQGDTPGSVADTLFADSSKSAQLLKWNGGSANFKAGKILYYPSPIDAQDGQMKSFYQERGVTPGEYSVKSGDWLSKIANSKLGSPLSWTEIAVVNGIERPDRLENGTQIAVYPRDLSSYRYAPQAVAETEVEEPVKEAPVAQNNQVANQQVPQEPVIQESETTKQPPPQPVVQEQPQTPAVSPVVQDQGDSGGNFLEQNLLFLVLGGGVIILLAAMMSIRRKKKAKRASSDDDLDESYNPPTKFKRN